ncbi:PadR family transcriptional regulator [Actinomadura sp. NAK00032]|uniref:PadR family transcriptional regulator n=1 Tax=Actinomadura sp. NAK00032 TaxID=2742128 RepID=UPI00158FA251|nr:PadR family transcriptional regulator [Actinomadura sp. NAK00032]QKW38736.1 PadR family transcriptional regulator [Actinomadura sp. NAK00032]
MSLRHAMLGLIAEMDGASGYDLLRMFEISLGNVWPARQSQLYGELGKLTGAGLIEVAEEGPRGRKEYRITKAGRAELHDWIVDVPAKSSKRDDALLRVFFLGLVDPAEAQRYMRRHSEGLGDYLAELLDLEGRVEWDDDNLSVYGRLVIEYGKRFAAMRRDWFDWALQEIEALERRE